jgi:hypothetical protein
MTILSFKVEFSVCVEFLFDKTVCSVDSAIKQANKTMPEWLKFWYVK